MNDISPERKALFDELAALVEKFIDLENREDGEYRSIATAHVLIIGAEEFDPETGDTGGCTVVLPARGQQASWKTSGLLNMAKALLEVDHNCGTP